MLQEKTKGNLIEQEAQLVDDLLYELRLRFVQAQQGRQTDHPNPEDHVPRHGHLARRADDRLRLRHLPVRRSARPPAPPLDLHSRPTTAQRAGRCRPRPARAGADARHPPRRRDPLHARPRRSHPRPRRCPAVQSPAAAADAVLRRRARRSTTSAGCSATRSIRARRRAAACRSSRLFDDRRRRSASAGWRSCRCRSSTASGRFSACGSAAFAYLTDCSRIPEESLAAARRPRRARARRASRSAAPDALLAGRGDRRRRRIGARRTYFTHMCHDLPHAATSAPAAPGDGAGLRWAGGECWLDPRSAARAPRTANRDHDSFPGRPAAPLEPAGAGARQLRRPAPRAHEDHRPRPAPRRRARRHAGGDDLRSRIRRASSGPTRRRRC